MKIFGINFDPFGFFDRQESVNDLNNQRQKHKEKSKEWHKSYNAAKEKKRQKFMNLISLAVQGKKRDVWKLKRFIRKYFSLWGDASFTDFNPLLKEVVDGHLKEDILILYFSTYKANHLDEGQRRTVYSAYKDGKISRSAIKKMLGRKFTWKPDEKEYSYLVELNDVDLLKAYVSKNHPKHSPF